MWLLLLLLLLLFCPFEHYILKECITSNNMVIKGTNYIFLEFEELTNITSLFITKIFNNVF
jgi:hypothetical protein